MCNNLMQAQPNPHMCHMAGPALQPSWRPPLKSNQKSIAQHTSRRPSALNNNTQTTHSPRASPTPRSTHTMWSRRVAPTGLQASQLLAQGLEPGPNPWPTCPMPRPPAPPAAVLAQPKAREYGPGF